MTAKNRMLNQGGRWFKEL